MTASRAVDPSTRKGWAVALSAASSADLRATLQALSNDRNSWTVELAPSPDAGWLPLPTLVDPAEPAVLNGLVARIAGRLGGCETRVAASTLQLGMAARIWNATLGSVLRDARLPVPADFVWRDDSGAAHLGAGELRGQQADASGELIESLRREVLDAVQADLVAALVREHGVAEQLLWGNVAAGLAGVARVLGLADPDGVVATLLEDPRLAGHMQDGRRARTCCLFYRVMPGAGLCGDCVFDSAPNE